MIVQCDNGDAVEMPSPRWQQTFCFSIFLVANHILPSTSTPYVLIQHFPFNMRAWAVIVSALLPLAAAQANNDIELGLKAIEAHFSQSHIVPDFLSTFQPKALLDVNYGVSDSTALTALS